MWGKIERDWDCFQYLKNGSRDKIDKVFNYLIDGNCNDGDFYKILKDYGHFFSKHQHLSLVNSYIELKSYNDYYLIECLGELNLTPQERMLIFIKLVNSEDSNEEYNGNLEKLINNSSFIFNEDELVLITGSLIKSEDYKGMKIIYDNICLPKFLSNIIEPILIMNKLTEDI